MTHPPATGGQGAPKKTRAGFVLAGVFLAAVIAAGTAIAIMPGGQPAAPPPTPSSSRALVEPSPATGRTAPTTPATSEAPAARACNRKAARASTTTPPQARWGVVKSVAVPFSPQAGPAIVRGQVARCYARNPHGALIAAWQISVRFLLADSWQKITRLQVLPGPGRDAYIRSRAAITDDLDRPGAFAQLAGYRFVHYDPDVAVIHLVSRTPSATLQVNTLTVRWADGDWRLVLHDDGAISPTVQRIPSLEGFIVWGGV